MQVHGELHMYIVSGTGKLALLFGRVLYLFDVAWKMWNEELSSVREMGRSTQCAGLRLL